MNGTATRDRPQDSLARAVELDSGANAARAAIGETARV